MPDTLLVPIHLDALRLTEPRTVASPPADFTRLPWSSGTRDRNPDTPYLAEAIASQPFQNQNLRLAAGVHLHWSLPDALTRAIDGEFAPVPNRWMVTRFASNGSIQAQWVVESDYLHPPGLGTAPDAIVFPVTPGHRSDPPFRYCGRTVPLASWTATPPLGAAYLPLLTAIGHGDPTFAAFYPSCRGVFGLHDPFTSSATGTRYEVFGWYSAATADPLARLRARHPGATAAALRTALRDELRWTIADTQNVPDGIVCYARLTLNTSLAAPADGPVSVAVGNTGTEALSAHLAAGLAPATRENQLLLERQLEGAQLATELERRTADTAPKFREARHEKGFTAIEAGTLWSVVPQATPGTTAAAPDAQAREELTLPATLAHQLNAANTLQNDYDRACVRVRSLRRQLFADWYRYLLCAYPPLANPDPLPDADAVRDYIERRTLPHLEAAVAGAGTLTLQTDAAGRVTGATGTPADSAAGRLAAAIGALLAQTTQLNQAAAVTAAKTRYAVTRRSSPRYWLPAEPVVLLAGAPATPSLRHGCDGRMHPQGLLECALLTGSAPAALFPAGLSTLRARVQQLSTAATPCLAFTTSRGQPWNPLLLEWLVELFPARDPDGGDLYGAGYPADYVTRNYRLGGEDTDLRHQGVHFLRDGNQYHGTSILTPGAGRQLQETLARELARRVKPLLMDAFYASLGVPGEGERGLLTRRIGFNGWLTQNVPGLPPLPADDGRTATEQVDAWLRGAAGPASAWAQGRGTVLTDFYTAKSVAAAQRNETWLHQHLDDFLAWYREQVADGAEEDDDATPEEMEEARAAVAALKDGGLLVTLRAAFVRLAATPCLAQSLSGFNDALRMRRQGYQLPVADPLAFPDAQPFVEAVARAVGSDRVGAPQPLDDFLPLRAGALRLDRLRLVDTFGQARDVEWTAVTASEPLAPADTVHPVVLPPRIVQPLRLNFRWLAADSEEVEMNEHPATSPVCGWVLPNHLDGSVMVYDAAGLAVGALTASADEPWRPAPGADRRVAVDDIPSPALRRMVRWMAERQRASLAADEDTPFLERFLGLVDSALEHIEPDYAAHHRAQALLVGRPLALVRATVDLELQGLPAPRQGWNAFRQDLGRAGRDTHGFPEVRFPVRLGEHGQLNDGLVGYWVEENEGYAGDRFYAPQSEADDAEPVAGDPLVPRGAAPIYLEQALSSPPAVVSMLVDPRGVVHATCGVAPTKSIDIPADQYQPALRALEVTFLTAPLLAERGTVRVSLPDEPGYTWSWLARGRDGWTERGTAGVLTLAEAAAEFGSAGQTVWQRLLDRGWTALIETGRASVVPPDRRTEATLGTDLADAEPRVEALLARTHILPFQTVVAFTGAQELREGWLKLRAEAGAAAGADDG